jgi:hypothetical protein
LVGTLIAALATAKRRAIGLIARRIVNGAVTRRAEAG